MLEPHAHAEELGQARLDVCERDELLIERTLRVLPDEGGAVHVGARAQHVTHLGRMAMGHGVTAWGHGVAAAWGTTGLEHRWSV